MRSIGLRAKAGVSGPCLHDLRHSFAVRSLEQCCGTQIEISRQITALSTYMGHSHVSDTYWYLLVLTGYSFTNGSNISCAGKLFSEGGKMTTLAQFLSAFLREYLPLERRASLHTSETYAYTFQLLLVNYAAKHFSISPSQLTLEQLNVELIVDFLNFLETERGNTARTRNARCAAIKAFFKYLEYRNVAALEQCRQISAIPVKKTDDRLVNFLTAGEMQVLLDMPDIRTSSGIRDRAMIYLCFAAGLRVSELIGLHLNQLEFGSQTTIHVIGKGRKERILPLWTETVETLNAWIAIRPDNSTTPELFLNNQGRAMTRSGFRYILSKHANSAMQKLPSLAKKQIFPHVLRHSCAMQTLKATHDIRKVSLWLGHADLRSTSIYLRANPEEKLETLLAVIPPNIKKGKFKAPDKLMAMLQAKK